MAYKYEAPFIPPRGECIEKEKPKNTTTATRPKKKRCVSRRKLLAWENLYSNDFKSLKYIENEFPIGKDGNYVLYTIIEIVDRVSEESRTLRRLVAQIKEREQMDFFPPSDEERALVEFVEEKGIYNSARTRVLQNLGFFGEPWKWGAVFSAISIESWRRRKLRAAWRKKKILQDAEKADRVHNLSD